MARKYMFLVLFMIGSVYCETSGNSTEQHVQDTSLRKSREIRSYIGLVTCAMNYDVSCFVNAAEDYLEVQRTTLLAEADEQALHSTGRSDPDSKPSHLAHTISQLVGQLTNMFRNGLSGFFSYGREAVDENDEDDEDDSEVDENELADTTTGDSNGVARASRKIARGHKKKDGLISKIIRTVKSGIYTAVFTVKLFAVLAMFNTFINFKLLLVAMWGLALLALKVWILHKQGSEQIIVHEDVHHDHHYEDDHHYEHLPVEDWHRTYLPKEDYAQKIAYRGQKPKSSSWLGWLD